MKSASSMHEAGHPKLVPWDKPEGLGGEVGGGFRMRGSHVYLQLIHGDIWQKPSQYHEVTTLQLKLIS